MPPTSHQNDYVLNPRSSPDLVSYPKTSDISINGSDLKIKMRDFKDAVKESLSLPILLAILSLWTPLFTSDFKGLFGLKPEEIKAGYIVFSIMVTLLFFNSLFFTICLMVYRLLSFFNVKNFSKALEKFETDPDKKVEQVLAFCEQENVIVSFNGLRIISAYYGAGSVFWEVTQKIKDLVKEEKVNFTVTNALVPSDPAQGIVKTLRVEYEYEGSVKIKEFKESETAIIP